VAAKVKTMYTDPKKIRVNDKGNPYGCVVFNTHKHYTPEWQEIETRCQAGTLGCVDCKNRLTQTLNAGLEPIRSERARWVNKTSEVRDIVEEGSKTAAQIAQATMADVRQAVKLAEPGKVGKL